MDLAGGGGLESASISAMSSVDINPATITFISVPDYDFSPSGSVSLTGSSSVFVGVGRTFESSWSVEGLFLSGFVSEWEVGEGEYRWYRVEGSCGEVTCDNMGILHDTCQRMTFMTVVGARNVSELCRTLSNPSINPRVDAKITSIKKYSRPTLRSDTSPECNALEEQEFCQVAECLDYCLDQDVRQDIPMSMRAIESIFAVDMAGGLRLFGQVQTDRNKFYIPEFPVIQLGGFSQSSVVFVHSWESSLAISGESEVVSNAYTAESSGGIEVGGYARTSSPSRIYAEIDGGVELFGSSRLVYAPNAYSSPILASGSSSNHFMMSFAFSGKMEFGGRVVDYTSPTYIHQGSGGLTLSGDAERGFYDLGRFVEEVPFSIEAFGFGSESSPLRSESDLTIAAGTVSPSCGCGPIGLSLNIQSNILNSKFLNSFLKRAGLSLAETSVLRYRSSDISWRSNQNLLGRGRDGVSLEDLDISYSLSCSGGLWVFSFSAATHNRTTMSDLRTKFVLDIPADLICSDGNISTVIELDILSGEFSVSTGRQVSVVDPARPIAFNPTPRRTDVFVDGVFSDKRLYYDQIGMFKDSYWSSKPLRMVINPSSRTKMSKIELYKIFPT